MNIGKKMVVKNVSLNKGGALLYYHRKHIVRVENIGTLPNSVLVWCTKCRTRQTMYLDDLRDMEPGEEQ